VTAAGGAWNASTVMALLVVAFDRLVWRRLHVLGEERFTLSR